ncbi:MAG TPA: 50S ribosomal protein L29 [Candidatus Woesearchaeota archaeon]|nr:50S ribosomal protein L29 [Candidatus Woesearchaeota archaeon]
MAILHMAEMRKMKSDELENKISDLKKELMRVRTQISQGTSPEKPGRVKEVRKTIARILTLKKERGAKK